MKLNCLGGMGVLKVGAITMYHDWMAVYIGLETGEFLGNMERVYGVQELSSSKAAVHCHLFIMYCDLP
jgi:hypothetical protein